MSFPLHALGASFGLGVVYYVAAIPAGAALGLPIPLAALSGLAGYCAIAAIVAFCGAPFRNWIAKKTGFQLTPDPSRWFWRIWQKWGMPGLGLIAPLTCGPYIAALIGVGLGQSPARTLVWIGIGGTVFGLAISLATALGVSFLPGPGSQ